MLLETGSDADNWQRTFDDKRAEPPARPGRNTGEAAQALALIRTSYAGRHPGPAGHFFVCGMRTSPERSLPLPRRTPPDDAERRQRHDALRAHTRSSDYDP